MDHKWQTVVLSDNIGPTADCRSCEAEKISNTNLGKTKLNRLGKFGAHI